MGYIKCVVCGEEYEDWRDMCPNCQMWTYQNEAYDLPLDEECNWK